MKALQAKQRSPRAQQAGTTEVKIPLDGLTEAPQDVVVYETLLKDDEVVLEHHERDNSEQTVSTIKPRIATTALDESDGDHEILNDAEVHVIRYRSIREPQPRQIVPRYRNAHEERG